MDTIHQPPGNPADPPPEVTPYFRRVAEFRRVLDAEAAARGLDPEPWAPWAA
jgi:hypothetical protein